MGRSEGFVHSKLPHDAIIHTREPEPARTRDEEQTSRGFEQFGLEAIAEQLQNLATRIENAANPVDEYNSAAISGAGSSAVLTVSPTYEYMPEKITSIIITGPAGSISLQLGDRIWALSIPASGVLVIAPVALMLGRSDSRILTPGAAGVFTLELMGIADRRFNI
jgi:hypothetical protein